MELVKHWKIDFAVSGSKMFCSSHPPLLLASTLFNTLAPAGLRLVDCRDGTVLTGEQTSHASLRACGAQPGEL